MRGEEEGMNFHRKEWIMGVPFGMLPHWIKNPVDSCAKIVIEKNQKDWNRSNRLE
jgi:hypothetical protein